MYSGVDIALFEAANQLSGRSFTLDALMALTMADPLVKGGPIAACFLFAWWSRGDAQVIAQRRRVLLLTLATLFVLAPFTKVVSHLVGISPRPLVQAEQTVVLDHGQLRELPRLAYTPPRTGLAAKFHSELKAGTVDANELASFPSDHAALFAVFAVGIFLAMRGPGLIAIGWAVGAVMLPRVVTGLHWPSDMLAGSLVGLGLFALVLLAGRTVLARPLVWATDWTERHRNWAQALMFLLLAEATSAMATLERVVDLAIGSFVA